MAVRAPICDLGEPARDLDLPGTDGRRHRLADVKGGKGTVVVFICNHCPYVKAITGRLAADAREIAAEGIATVAICSNDAEAYPADSLEVMQRFASTNGLPFLYLHDTTQEVARAYGALCTPDLFGSDADLRLQYRDRLDASRTSLVPDARRDLVEAMRLVARTGRGPDRQAASMGCSIKWRYTRAERPSEGAGADRLAALVLPRPPARRRVEDASFFRSSRAGERLRLPARVRRIRLAPTAALRRDRARALRFAP